MFFQVDCPAQKLKPKDKVLAEPEEVPILSLAPFTPIPKVCFDNVVVGSNVSKTLIIYNPTPNDIMLYITKTAPEERFLSLSWAQCMIQSHEKVELGLLWQAKTEGAWKDTIIFDDGCRLKKVVGVIFKAIKPKKVKPKPKKVVKCVSTKVKSPKKWFSPKHKSSSLKSPKSNVRQTVLPDITNIPQIFINSPNSGLTVNNIGKTNHATYLIKNKENFEISGIENLSYTNTVSTTLNKIATKKYLYNTLDINNCEENFEDSLEIKKNNAEDEVNFRLNEVSQQCNIFGTPLGMEDRLKAITLTPVNNFRPSLCSTGEKTQYFSTDNALDASNISSATYNIDRKSSEFNVDEKICNISSSTYIKETFNSNTYTKEGILPELTFSSPPSPVPFEANNRKDNPIHQLESNYNYGETRPMRCLEQIKEESYTSFSASSLNFAETRKRRNENEVQVISPKRRISQIPYKFENSLLNESHKRSFFQTKPLNLKEFVIKSRNEVIGDEEDIAHFRQMEMSKQIEMQPFSTQDPFILTATNSIDPFMSSTMYYDPKWVDEQENSFKKWLNALLTPPEELNSNAEGTHLNVAKLFQDCKNREVSKAPTKEAVSNKYHTRNRLQSLRRSAANFFRSPAISGVLGKICNMIENEKLVIRTDKNVHLDLGLQTEIITLFLSYNPLWLRIGLETVYNTPIPIHSNSDVVGLTMFITENFFKDRYLLKKYKSIHSNKYAINIKKRILNKFFMIVFFLDKAKEEKLIPHDPCLFCKNSVFKESRDIILRFSRELLSSIGDVTKIVKCTGYLLTHKQTYIHEFDYAIGNLGADLRDGVRLTKVMEIILVMEGLTPKLRTPAISRLQKVHNMKVVFDALKQSGCTILYDIEPKDIVDGHKEKTLSFLWQIIYKFQAPRIKKAVVTIQKFWRSLQVIIKRRVLQRERFKREQAALRIQRWFRRNLLARKLNQIIPRVREVFTLIKRERAVTILQKYVRMLLARRQYSKLRNTIIRIQSYIRRYLVVENINAKAVSAIKIQAYFKMYLARKRFLSIKASARRIQEIYTANKMMRIDLNYYQRLKCATLYIQSKFRAKKAMKRDMEHYAQMKYSAILIKSKYRAYKLMRIERESYLNLKAAVISIQQLYRANRQLIIERERYLTLKRVTVFTQRRFRANRLARIQRNDYLQIKKSAEIIQIRYRAFRLMKKEHNYFSKLKNATVVIQQRFRANKLARLAREQYQNLKRSVQIVEERYKAKKLVQKESVKYKLLKQAAVVIQRRFRAKLLMRTQRALYLQFRRNVITIQQRFRAKQLMKSARNNFLELRKATLTIQRWFRNLKLGHDQRTKYLKIKLSVRIIEEHYRALQLARKELYQFQTLKRCTIMIQRKFKTNKLMKTQRNLYLSLKNAAIFVQSRYRSNNLTKSIRNNYLNLRNACIVIQRRYRALKLMKLQRSNFLQLKNATVFIQQFLAKRSARRERLRYLRLKSAIKIIENRYQAKLLYRIHYNRFNILKKSVIVVQQRFRAKCLMRDEREKFIKLKTTTIMIQQRYRAIKAMKVCRQQYDRYRNIYNATLTIQKRFRAALAMRIEKRNYLEIRKATIVIQSRYRAKKSMEIERIKFVNLKNAVRTIENKYTANKLMKQVQTKYENLKKTTICIQRRYRNMLVMRKLRRDYLLLRKTVISAQRRFRSNKLAVKQRNQYTTLIKSVVLIQRIWRMKLAFRKRIFSIVIIQAFARGFLERKLFNQEYLPLLLERREKFKNETRCATKIQAYWRGYKTRSLENPEMREIRKKAKVACQKATLHETLAYRKQKALKIMVSHDSTIDQIITALQDLEFETRLFEQSCIDLSKCLPEELYRMINTSSRSQPEMIASTAATDILINFCKYSSTIDNCWFPKYIDNMFTVMIHWCDKDCPLFLRLCTLIWHLAQETRRKRIIRSIPGLLQKLTKIKQLCTRKHKMSLRLKKNGVDIFCTYRNLPMPSLQTEWGLDYKHKPRVFKNALHAMDSVLKTLDISC